MLRQKPARKRRRVEIEHRADMAESAEGFGDSSAQCGFCLQKGPDMLEAKVLQCSHAHCLECLKENKNVMGIIHCPTCQEDYDLDPVDLPSATVEDGVGVQVDVVECDACLVKGLSNSEALVYCKPCGKKLCSKHQEYHDELHPFHEKLNMGEYRAQATKLEVRNCPEHRLTYAFGCRTCFSVLCDQCITEADSCNIGSSHPPVLLDTLVLSLTKELRELKSELMGKEDKLQDLFKKLSEILAEFDGKTTEMVEKIHRQRGEQIKAIEEQYVELEKELIRLRAESKVAIEEFMEQEVGALIHKLSKHCLKIEARIKHEHQVDFVTAYEEIKNQIEVLLTEKMPMLAFEQLSFIESNGESRTIEVKIVSDYESVIEFRNGLTTLPSAPQTLELIKAVGVSDMYSVRSVCHYKGLTYAVLENNSIDRIDSDFKLTPQFLTFENYPTSVAVHEDRLYTLIRGSPSTVFVYSLSGQLITSWSHTDIDDPFNKLCIECDMVVIFNRANEQLTIYSLSGEIIRQIPIRSIAKHELECIALCAAGSQCVILSIYGSSKLLKVNIATGNIVWTFTHVKGAFAVTVYRKKWLLVVAQRSDQILVVDIETGELNSKLPLGDHHFSWIFDLHASGTTLLIAGYRKVVHYKLE